MGTMSEADKIAAELLGTPGLDLELDSRELAVIDAAGIADSTETAAIDNSARVGAQRSTKDNKIITLLGQGISAEIAASACGVTPSYVSQLMSQDSIIEEVTELRFKHLQKHNDRDNTYDKLEDKVLKQLESQLATVFDPLKLTRILATLNGAKRRGQSAPEQLAPQNTVVTLVMPTQIVQKFTTNINNQVINAGEQTLQTIQSGVLFDATKRKLESDRKAFINDDSNSERIEGARSN